MQAPPRPAGPAGGGSFIFSDTLQAAGFPGVMTLINKAQRLPSHFSGPIYRRLQDPVRGKEPAPFRICAAQVRDEFRGLQKTGRRIRPAGCFSP